jgi:hypothetical protein
LAARRGAHRTRRGPFGVAVLVLVWLLVAAVVVTGVVVAVRAVATPLLDVVGRVV